MARRTYRRDANGRFAGGGGGGGSAGARKPTRYTKGQRKAAMNNARTMLRADVKTSRRSLEKGPEPWQSAARSAMAANFRQRRKAIREAATALGVARGKKRPAAKKR